MTAQDEFKRLRGLLNRARCACSTFGRGPSRSPGFLGPLSILIFLTHGELCARHKVPPWQCTSSLVCLIQRGQHSAHPRQTKDRLTNPPHFYQGLPLLCPCI